MLRKILSCAISVALSFGLMLAVGCDSGPTRATGESDPTKTTGPALKVAPSKKLRKNQKAERPGPSMKIVD
jgi:hypothetical protein